MTHTERSYQRMIAANAVRQGEAPIDVASRYGKSVTWIYQACREFKVALPPVIRSGENHPQLVVRPSEWDAVDWTRRNVDIAREMGVTRERVRQIRRKRGKPDAANKHQHQHSIEFRLWVTENRERLARMTLNEILTEYTGVIVDNAARVILKNMGVVILNQRAGTIDQIIQSGGLEKLIEKKQVREDLSECWEWVGPSNGICPYPVTSGSRYLRHTVFAKYHGTLQENTILMNVCANQKCLNPDHLKAGTWKEAMANRDRYRKSSGRTEWEKVEEIRRLFAGGKGVTDLATQFGLSHATVYNMVRGKSHLTPSTDRRINIILDPELLAKLPDPFTVRDLAGVLSMPYQAAWNPMRRLLRQGVAVEISKGRGGGGGRGNGGGMGRAPSLFRLTGKSE